MLENNDMLKKNRKFIIMTVLLSTLILTACTRESGETADGTPVTLVYGTMNLEQEMSTWIAEYNLTHEDYQIAVREYGQDGFEEGLTRLNAEIVRGNGPDLLDLSNIDVGSYISLGVLADLYPLMDADTELQREIFVPGILKLYEENGHLYGIAPGYRLETIMGEKALLGDPSEWTVEKMNDVIESLPEGSCFINNLGSLGLLRIVLQRGMDEYVDWEAADCSFDSDQFKELLQLAAVMDTLPVFDNDEQAIAEGKVLTNRLYVSDLGGYAASSRLFQGESVVCVGYPSPKGGSALVTPYLPVGICCEENQDAAWEFVKSLLGEEFQEKHIRFNFPLRQDSLQKQLEKSMIRSVENEPADEAIRQEDCDALYEAIYSANNSRVFDANIWDIVSEEAEAYFDGDKTLDQVVQIIQNRVKTYIQENYT